MKKKKIGICSILSRIRIQNRTRIHHPGNGSADQDPHQNDTDPKHWLPGSALGKASKNTREKITHLQFRFTILCFSDFGIWMLLLSLK